MEVTSFALNAQNFPRKSNDPRAFEYVYGIKKMFVSRFGADGLILQADYSQLELRIAAIFSNDKELMNAYKAGKDIHIYVASKVHKIPESEVTKDQRTAAKAVGFGLLYGKGAYSLAQDMKVDLEEAQEFIDTYFKEFAGVKKWLDNTRKQVSKNKRVKTLTGRWRRLAAIDSTNRATAADAERQAVNSPIQGSGSDITLSSLIALGRRLRDEGFRSVICMTVHDSIVLDVHKDELVEVYKLVKEVMENPPFDWVTVPIVADVEIGRNYGDLVYLKQLSDLDDYKDVYEYIDVKFEEKKKEDLEKAMKN
ncbi:DNA polymerase I [Bacillus phage vB_BsuM-Goe26]|nr:DNA polymerase I [Bacillus phage vB_BsuM-Goe26]